MTARRKTGREYRRVSLDRSGREKSNTEQHDENEAGAAALGIRLLADGYSDIGSASRGKRKRDDFERLLCDLDAGTFGADVLVLWESSRGSRKVGEWCRLIDAAEVAGVGIAVTTHGRLYDAANARDRRTLQEDAVDSEYETAKIGQRVTRDAAAAARAGRPHGPLAFGYSRHVDEARKIVQTAHPVEAPRFVAYCDDVLAGRRTLTDIAEEMGRSITGVRTMLTNPLYIAVRHYKGTDYPGDWPALITVEQHKALCRLLDGRQTGPRAGASTFYPFTGLLFCGCCGTKLRARRPNAADRFARYVCFGKGCHKVASRACEVDAYLDGLLDAAVTDAVTGDPTDTSDAVVALRDEQARLSAKHAEILGEYNGDRITMADFQVMRAANDEALAAVQTALDEADESLDLGLLVGDDGQPITLVGDEDRAAVDDVRKAAVARRLIRRVVVRPSGRHVVADWPDLIDVEWR